MSDATTKKAGLMAQKERLMQTLTTMEMRLDTIIKDRGLDAGVSDQLFKDYSPFQLEQVAVPIVTLFIRHSLLLGIYDSFCNYGLQKLSSALSEDDKKALHELRKRLTASRIFYVDVYGINVLRSFRNAIVTESVTNTEVTDLESLLVRFFGSASSVSVKRLQTLVHDSCIATRRFREAAILLECIDRLAAAPQATTVSTNTSDPDTAAMVEVLTDIEAKEKGLKKTLDRIIKERGLERPGHEVFKTWSYRQMESIAVHVQNNFSRASLLLSCWEAELKFTALQHGLTKMSDAVKRRYAEALDCIDKMRTHYIDDIGASVLRGLLTVLQVKAGRPAKTVTPLDNVLLTYFGVGMSNPGDYNSPAYAELCALFDALGVLTNKKAEAQKLLRCLTLTSQLEPPKPLK